MYIYKYFCTFAPNLMSSKPHNRLQNELLRHSAQLLSANVFAQAVGLLVYPLLTRIYTPDDFALLSLFTSIVGVAVLLGNAEYHYAIVLPQEESKARALVWLSTMLTLTVTAVLLLSVPFAGSVAELFKAPELARWWWGIPVCVLVMGLWNILSYWYIRRKAFTRISGYQVSQSVLSATGKIGFGAMGWLHGGQILATIIAPFLSLMISVGLAWKKHVRELFVFRYEDVRSVAREYADFPKFNLPRAFVNSLGLSLPIWLLTPQYGLDQVGRLSLAIMASFLPLNIISRACYQVLYQRVSEMVQNRQRLHSVLRPFVLRMGGLTIFGLAAIYWFLPQLVTFLFGAEWLETAEIIRRLYPYLVLTPVCGSICFLSDVFAKQQTAMWMEVGYVAAIALALVAGIEYSDFAGTISLFAVTRFVFLTIQLFWFGTLVRSYHKTLS